MSRFPINPIKEVRKYFEEAMVISRLTLKRRLVVDVCDTKHLSRINKGRLLFFSFVCAPFPSPYGGKGEGAFL